MSRDQEEFNIDIDMSPKDDEFKKHNPPSSEKESEEDLQEIVDVNASIDRLNSLLDSMEARADSIMSQLVVLLDSNKEIRKSINEDNDIASTEDNLMK